MMDAGWRRLAAFWAVILAVGAGGAAALQVMGPPGETAARSMSPASGLSAGAHEGLHGLPHTASPIVPASSRSPGPPTPGVIRSPDSTLMEPAPDYPNRFLPRRGADGRVSMSYYARAPDAPDQRPKVAMLVVGLGQSDADSTAAIATLPGAVSLGFSPYSANPEALLADARVHGHEYLVTLPMESQGYPLNDSGPRALLTGADWATNDRNLMWVLSRIQGEVGLTGASDGLRGERFAGATELMNSVTQRLFARGLLYIDPRPGGITRAGVAAVSVVVDDPPDRVSIDAKLSQLEQRARDGEAVMGLAVMLRPVTVERVAAWARGLDSRGVTLVPVSALVSPK